MRRNAFTLIELLVVVAIIVSLIAILLPSMNKAIRAAETATELSNYRQASVAVSTYSADNQLAFVRNPGRTGSVATTIFRSSLSNLAVDMKKYIGNFEIWRCVGLDAAALIDDPLNTRNLSYGTVQYFADRKQGALFGMTEGTPSRITEPKSASTFPLIQCVVRDARGNGGGFQVGHPLRGGGLSGNPVDNPSSKVWRVVGSDDNEGASIVFMDGHARWISGTELQRTAAGDLAWSVMPQR